MGIRATGSDTVSRAGDWPDLALTPWEDSRDTLHLWTQIVGKVRLGAEPMVNHWWQVPLYVSARGLTTRLMSIGHRGLEIEFDFISHLLAFRTTDGETRSVALEPRSVADFYRAVRSTLADLDLPVEIYPRPDEIEDPIPFERDELHRSYDAGAVHRYWLALVQAHRVMVQFRSGFIGKVSPVHYFWGSTRAECPTSPTGCLRRPTATRSAVAASGPAGPPAPRSTRTPIRRRTGLPSGRSSRPRPSSIRPWVSSSSPTGRCASRAIPTR